MSKLDTSRDDKQLDEILVQLMKELLPSESFYPESADEHQPLHKALQAISNLIDQRVQAGKLEEIKELQKKLKLKTDSDECDLSNTLDLRLIVRIKELTPSGDDK